MIPDPQPAEESFWHAFGLEKVALRPDCATEEELPTPAEVDLISTVVALAATAPAAPSAQVWEEIHSQISGKKAPTPFFIKHRRIVSAWSGWGVAASLAVLFAWRGVSPSPPAHPNVVVKSPAPSAPSPATGELSFPASPAPAPAGSAEIAASVALPLPVTPPPVVSVPAHEGLTQGERAEKHRLIQEIETLRGQLARLQERTQERLAIIPGVSWPVVIEMYPPGVQMETVETALTSRLGDALVFQAPPAAAPPAAAAAESGALAAAAPTSAAAGASRESAAPLQPTASQPQARPTPSAIPIYDPARDVGTLALHHFDLLQRTSVASSSSPTANTSSRASGLGTFSNPSPTFTDTTSSGSIGTVYSLWVKASATGEPILVGQLPNDLPANTSVDFSLGTTGIIPQGYYILGTQAEQPLHYNPQNILLQGP